MMVNEYAKQFFLYAKGWYQSSGNVWNDLEKLHAVNHLPEADRGIIINKITQCAFEVILDNKRNMSLVMMQKFIDELSPSYFLRTLYNEPYDYDNEVIRLCLSIMRFAEIKNLDPNADCLFDVLPPSNGVCG